MALCPSPSANTLPFLRRSPVRTEWSPPTAGSHATNPRIPRRRGTNRSRSWVPRNIRREENTIDHDSTHGGASMLLTIKPQGTGFPFAGAIHPAKHLCRLASLHWIGHELLYCEE